MLLLTDNLNISMQQACRAGHFLSNPLNKIIDIALSFLDFIIKGKFFVKLLGHKVYLLFMYFIFFFSYYILALCKTTNICTNPEHREANKNNKN